MLIDDVSATNRRFEQEGRSEVRYPRGGPGNRARLINRYGLEAATAMLAPLKSNVLTFGDGKQRLYTFHGQSLRLRQ